MFRVRRIDAATPTANQRVEVIAPGKRVRSWEVTVLPATAKTLVGVSIGPDGDVIPLQNESLQQYPLEGDDQTRGVYLALVSGAPTGNVFLTMVMGDAGAQ